jgi:uncharacterized protein (TIGR02611 family)
MGIVARWRETLVLGHVRRGLDRDERIVAWSHASVPGKRAPGLFVVTDRRCLLHVASGSFEDVSRPLERLDLFRVDRHSAEVARVHLLGDDTDVVAEFSLTSRVRARTAGGVLRELTRADIGAPAAFDPSATSPLPPIQRSMRHHARRAWVTVVGVVVLILSLLFASPFVPGPGALTAVAGFAILAKEYEWARDIHVWAARQADRFVRWAGSLRRRKGTVTSLPDRAVRDAGTAPFSAPFPELEPSPLAQAAESEAAGAA